MKGWLLVAVGAIILAIAFFRWPARSTFDADKWKSGSHARRGAMVQDLIGNMLLVGKARSEVLQILDNRMIAAFQAQPFQV